MIYRTWHTREEKRVIKKLGGKPLKKNGTDGTLRGRPCEVRSARKDTRYRIMKSTHEEMKRKKGTYIFVKGVRTKTVSASRVEEIRRREGRRWYKDRNYPHTFIKVDEIF